MPFPEAEPKCLDDFGYPHICMYPDGSVYNLETGYHYSDAQDYIEVGYTTKVRFSFYRRKMYGYLFVAPWNYLTPYRFLDFLGFPAYAATYDGHIFGCSRMLYLIEDLSDDGYPEVTLYDTNHNPFYFKTHRLIALAFVPNPEHKNTVNHKNGIKTDNNVSNLEWMWNWENMDHALKTGLKHSAMSEEMVHATCQLLSQGLGQSEIASRLGIKESIIFDILDGCHYRISRLYQNIPYLPWARHIPKEFRNEIEHYSSNRVMQFSPNCWDAIKRSESNSIT